MLNFDDDKPNRDDDPYDRFASVTHKTVAKRSRNRRVWPPYLLKQTYSHFSAHWPSQSQLSSGLNDQPITVSVPCNEIRYNVTKYDTDLALPFRGCQSSQKNRKNIVKIPPSTTPTRATSPMSLGPRNVTPPLGISRQFAQGLQQGKNGAPTRLLLPWPATLECIIGARHRRRTLGPWARV